MPTVSNARAVIGAAALTVVLAAGCADRPSDSATTAPLGKDTATTVTESPTIHGTAPNPATSAVSPTSPSAAGSTWISGQPPGQGALDDAVQAVEPLLKRDFANYYAGLGLQQPTGPADKTPYALVIYRIPGSGLDTAVHHALPTTNVIFKSTKYNALDAQHTFAEISSDVSYWQSKGLRINAYGPLLDGRAQVGIDDPAEWAAAITARYGADRVVVNRVRPATTD